jgi:hypothetical protein
VLGLAAATLLAAPALGQQNSPHIGYVYPAGGQRGTTVHVKVGGRYLEGAAAPVVSGGGVRAEVVGYDKPLTQKEIGESRDKVQELLKGGPDPEVRRQVAELRLKMADSLRRNQNPVIAEIVALDILIEPEAVAGPRFLRLMTPLGLSDPVVFCVGQLPEFRENEEKQSRADAETAVTLPAVVNGRLVPGDTDRAQFFPRQGQQYVPGDVDRYRFEARKGADLIIAASARELMPYLADAVPGWFQAVLTLYDANGREVAYDDDDRFLPDPVIHFKVPSEGEYVVEIKDALYRGREDFVYRITIGEVPFLTSIFPLGGPAGVKTTVQATGWNLSTSRATMDATHATPGVYPLSMRRGEVSSNRVSFAVDQLPEVTEREPNDTAKTAQRISLPVIVNGRIQQPGDVDVYSFTGRAGGRIVAEVFGRRLGSPLDSVLELTDAAGVRVAFNDDHDDKAAALVTHQADSLIIATLPANGIYLLRIGDRQRKGGADYGYRLSVGPPRPDFELRMTPSAVNAAAGATIPVSVHAIRKDGFAGDIALSLKDASDGFSLSGGVVPAGQDQIRVTLTVPPVPTDTPVGLVVEGRATIDGRSVSHRAVPAENMMQAFAYRHLVPVDALRVSVIRRGATRSWARVMTPQPVRVPAGGSARIRVSLPPLRQFDQIGLELSEPPEGLSLADVSVTAGGAEIVVRADAAKAKAGSKGNLIVTVSGERVAAGNQAPKSQRRRLTLACLPAILFEIVP